MPEKEYTWYKLDNAARLYPAIRDTRNSTFRISFDLTEDIEKDTLIKALEITMPRFPTFCVKLKKGYFWYYLEPNDKLPPVEEENDFPCGNIFAEFNGFHLIKIIYYKKRISAEVFHSISDGLGTIEFLKTLTFEYLKLKGYSIADEGMIKTALESPKPYEMEDSFEKYYNHGIKKKRQDKHGYRLDGVAYRLGEQNIIRGTLFTSQLKEAAKSRNATITAFLASAYIYAIYKDQRLDLGAKKPVRIMIPVNLRDMFPSGTLRNFISHLIVGIDFKGPVTFDEILESVSAQIKELGTKEEMNSRINTNVNISKNIWIRITPLGVKNFGIKTAYKWWGEQLYTSILSNLSQVTLPPEMIPYVKDAHCIISATDLLPIKMAVCSYNGRCNITFSRCIEESDIIREFFKLLATEFNMDISMTGNGWRE